MLQAKVYEGIFEEIVTRYGSVLAHRRIKIVVEEEEEGTFSPRRPFYETATPEEWAQALREWASSHAIGTPSLSDKAISRDSIYGR